MIDAAETKKRFARRALIYSTSLLCIKIVIIILTLSLTVIADTIDSVSDITLLFILRSIIKKANQPWDSQHTFGKGKYEAFGTLMQFVAVAIGYTLVIYDAVNEIESKQGPTIDNGFIGLGTFIGFMISNLSYGTYLRRKGKKMHSEMVYVQGINYSSDSIRNVFVLVAFLLLTVFGFKLADPIFAIAISIFVILYTLRSCMDSIENLVEKNPLTPDEMILIYEEVPNVIPEVHAVSNIRVARVGDRVFITMDVIMDEDMTLKVVHEKMNAIEHFIDLLFPDKKFEFAIHPVETFE
jgi:ferrous-iron efflux pump FieF